MSEDTFKEKQEKEFYGETCEEWLRRWDAGKTVWSVEMGWAAWGPGYEQAIQITAAEVLRYMIDNNAREIWDDKEKWKAFYAEMKSAVGRHEAVSKLGLSGAQWGGATSLAFVLYRKGPRATLTDPTIKTRKIQVSRKFPG